MTDGFFRGQSSPMSLHCFPLMCGQKQALKAEFSVPSRTGQLTLTAFPSNAPINDEGVAFLVKADGKTIYHAGDLNWWHWNGEPEDFNADIEKSYTVEINRLKGEKIDVAFVPADLRLQDKYFWAVNYFLKTVGAKRLFPMHFWGRFDVCTMLRQLGYGETIAEITQENEKFEI